MRRTSVGKRIHAFWGLATVLLAVFALVAIGGLIVSPLTGSLSLFPIFRAPVAAAHAQLGSLKNVQIPEPGNLGEFVKDKAAATMLGKALFWDVQVGGDGQTACATCHFSAGVDARVTNTVHPGPNGEFEIVTGPSEELTAAVFPFSGDPDTDDIVGSQGVVARDFLNIIEQSATDSCTDAPDNVFHPARQVTGRNAPNMIMAIFNRDNFWDGRAKRDFNGVNGSGGADPNARILVDNGEGAGLEELRVSIQPASQASQEVGPPNNGVEMSCAGRTFPQLGRKLLSLTPLGQQLVASNDSVLGALSRHPDPGLNTTYGDMIQAAFQERFWDSAETTDDGFTLTEANFSLFWGLAIQVYASTLIPDETPFDRLAEGNASALTLQQKHGLLLFMNKAQCSTCHGGPEFTNASIHNGGNGRAFANTGVRPTGEDTGREKGKFKTPTLRNVELSGPYFHNGGYLTLRQVVEFYNRGGDFPNQETQIEPLGLNDSEIDALVAFMLALTDERVGCSKAPFDHPSIDVPNGPQVSAVGAGGVPPEECVKPFLGADHFSGGNSLGGGLSGDNSSGPGPSGSGSSGSGSSGSGSSGSDSSGSGSFGSGASGSGSSESDPSGGGASGSGSSEVRETAKLTLTASEVTADVELRLRIRDGEKELRARARAEGALTPNAPFSLCMGTFFIEDDDAEDDGRLDIDEEVERGFSFVTLVGQTVSIREGGEQAGCTGAVVLEGAVTVSDLSGSSR